MDTRDTGAAVIKLPPLWARDADERGIPMGSGEWTPGGFFVTGADNPHLRALLADAEYYSDPQQFNPPMHGMARSARRAAAILRSALRERPRSLLAAAVGRMEEEAKEEAEAYGASRDDWEEHLSDPDWYVAALAALDTDSPDR